MGRVGGRVGRVEPRRRLRSAVMGMMAGLSRTNCWSLAEYAGEQQPRGMQRLLAEAVWDEDGVLADVRDWTVAHLGEADGVLILDETGDVKKGTRTVGVQRQYSGTAGRVENCQVAVYLTYASRKGHALMDRALYLPRSWTGDQARMVQAGVPAGVGFATKPTLARELVVRAIEAGVPAGWVTADEVYGVDPRLRHALYERGIGYVLAVATSHRVVTGIGARRAVDLAHRLPEESWQRLSAGRGAKGLRWYEWALIETSDRVAGPGGCHALLIRRNRSSGELAFYRTFTPRPVPLSTLVRVAGTRWRIEESFQAGKEHAALDEHQVRTWRSWQRWTACAILAHAFLSVMAATEPAPPDGLAPLTRAEISRLFTQATRPDHPARHVLAWSTWRRRHQARAQASHYQRQALREAS